MNEHLDQQHSGSTRFWILFNCCVCVCWGSVSGCSSTSLLVVLSALPVWYVLLPSDTCTISNISFSQQRRKLFCAFYYFLLMCENMHVRCHWINITHYFNILEFESRQEYYWCAFHNVCELIKLTIWKTKCLRLSCFTHFFILNQLRWMKDNQATFTEDFSRIFLYIYIIWEKETSPMVSLVTGAYTQKTDNSD